MTISLSFDGVEGGKSYADRLIATIPEIETEMTEARCDNLAKTLKNMKKLWEKTRAKQLEKTAKDRNRAIEDKFDQIDECEVALDALDAECWIDIDNAL